MSIQEKAGIWKFDKFYPQVSQNPYFTLNEGNTPLETVDNILFKLDYLNPTGSIKDRGFAYQFSYLYSKGIKSAVLSSSGNAAISAVQYAKIANINLTIFLSPFANKEKINKLQSLNAKIVFTQKPVSGAFIFANEKNAYNFRPSLDPIGHIGYSSIAFEIDQKLKIDALFIPVSSGTTLAGIAFGYKKLGVMPRIYAVQTEAVNPIARIYDVPTTNSKRSIADAIVAKFTPRQDEIISYINESHGGGIVVSDAEILSASTWLEKNKIFTSYEGAMTLAALWKKQRAGNKLLKPLCLLTGKKYDKS